MNHIISPLDLMHKLYSKTSKNDKIAFLSGFFMCLIIVIAKENQKGQLSHK